MEQANEQVIPVIDVVVPVCNCVYLQTEVDIRSMLSELTNGVYDKHSSKQNFYCILL